MARSLFRCVLSVALTFSILTAPAFANAPVLLRVPDMKTSHNIIIGVTVFLGTGGLLSYMRHLIAQSTDVDSNT